LSPPRTPANAVAASPIDSAPRTATDGDSSSGGEASTDAAAPAPTPMRNASRDRKRAELQALRHEASALERQQSELLRKRKQQVDMPPIAAAKWKSAAETERVARARAEAENERLVAMLQQQIGLADVLERAISKRARRDGNGVVTRYEVNVNPGSPRVHSDASTDMLCAQFSRDIQRMYKAGVGCIFGSEWSAASAELGLSVIREEKIDETTKERLVEMRETRHVPFEYHRVADAMWRCALHPLTEQHRVLETFGSTENQIATTYRAATPGDEDRGDLLTAVFVMQRFKEHNRSVQVWRIMSSSTEDRVSETQRAYSDERGWVIVEPVPPGIPGMEPGTAVVRFVAQIAPLWPRGGEAEVGDASWTVRTDDFHDLVVKSSCEDLVSLGDAVGNLLLDESLGLATDLHLV
jgi:hypothetical protein